MPPSHINYFLSPLNSRCSYAWNLRESVNMSLLITLEKISLLRLFEADVVLLLDGGTSDRGSNKAGQALSKQFVSRPPPHSSRTTLYSTRYFMPTLCCYILYINVKIKIDIKSVSTGKILSIRFTFCISQIMKHKNSFQSQCIEHLHNILRTFQT